MTNKNRVGYVGSMNHGKQGPPESRITGYNDHFTAFQRDGDKDKMLTRVHFTSPE